MCETNECPQNIADYQLTYAFEFSQAEVASFAELSGDNNPIHIDEAYARETVFKRPIVHGFLVGSVFSRIFGTQYPGIGTIYLSQSMKFLAPVFAGKRYQAKITVKEVNLQKNRAVVSTEIFNHLMKKVFNRRSCYSTSYFSLMDLSNRSE